MTTTVNLSSAPLSGGVTQTAITETVWLGAKRFLMVSAQLTPNATIAQLIELQNDPYQGGANAQTTIASLMLGVIAPIERPMLFRLDYNRVLMVYSQSKRAQDFQGNTAGTRSTDLAFDVMVLEIDSNNVLSVAFSGPAMAPASFMNANYTESSGFTSVSRASCVLRYGIPMPTYLGYGNSNSTVLPLGANRLLIAAREVVQIWNATSGNSSSASLYEVFYAAGALTITKRASLPTKPVGSISYTPQGQNPPTYQLPGFGFDDYPFVSALPGSSQVVFGYVNYDPSNGVVGASADVTTNRATVANFLVGNTAYVLDTEDQGDTWTPLATINYRIASVLCGLDDDRIIEITNQTLGGEGVSHVRVYTISTGSFSADFTTDYSLVGALNNNKGAAFGLLNQATLLDDDHVLLSFTNRGSLSPTSQTGPLSFWGIYRINVPVALTCTQYGCPTMSPLTFQRGQEAILPRNVQDPAVTGNPAAYDFVSRLSNTAYAFLRYSNPV